MRKIIAFTLAGILALCCCGIASAQYAYSFEDEIPREVQQKAFQYMLDLIQESSQPYKARTYSYKELLDIYLNYYGIYSPASNTNNEFVIWVQEQVKTGRERITYIPDRYISTEDLQDWVTRFAEPGDLLLYKVNGRADKCTIYAGEGKMIGAGFQENAMIGVCATFAPGETYRTRSGGLYAIAHIWTESEPEAVQEEKYLDPQVRLAEADSAFTQEHYTVWQLNPDSLTYEKCRNYILTEYTPGCYRFWNGTHYGFSEEYIGANKGVHLQLTRYESANNQIGKQIRIDISEEEAAANMGQDEAYVIDASHGDPQNTFPWDGKDLIQTIKEAGGDP